MDTVPSLARPANKPLLQNQLAWMNNRHYMPEDRMENQRPRPIKTGKTPGELGEGKADPPAQETKMVSDTPTPEEHDPLWEELGSTRVVKGDASGSNLSSPSNFTEISPSRVLGKDIVNLGDYRLVK